MKIEKLILSARSNAKLLTGFVAASWWDFNYFPIAGLLPIIACRGFPLFFSRQSVLPLLSLSLSLYRSRTLFVLLSPSSRVRQPAYLSPYNRFIYLLPRCKNELFSLSPLQISPASSPIEMASVHLKDEDSERNYARNRMCFAKIRSNVLQLVNLFRSLHVSLVDGQDFYQT